jgi:hypothetical protein
MAELSLHTDLTPYPRPGAWSKVKDSWIDVAAVADMVRKNVGTNDVSVHVAPNGMNGLELIAEVRTSTPTSVDLQSLRRMCLADIRGRRLLAVPDRFVLQPKG